VGTNLIPLRARLRAIDTSREIHNGDQVSTGGAQADYKENSP